MKTELFNREFNKMFTWFTSDSDFETSLRPEIDLSKKLLNFFLIGNSYYYILNHHSLSFELVSKEVEDVLGYSPREFTIEFINGKLHPDDRPWFVSLGLKVIEFFSRLPVEKLMKYKLRYDFRYRKKNGDYARILYQVILLEHDEGGRPLRSLALNTDITHLKNDGKPVLSFIGMDEEPSYIDVDTENFFSERGKDLTKRERQVLKLLIEGKVSSEIGDCLHITKQTVDTHRKNMLRKKNLTNTHELVGKAIRYGWI